MRKTPINKCTGCVVLDTAPCPLLDIAYRRGLSGMETCEMRTVIEKVVAKEKSRLTWGPKHERRPKIDIEGIQNEQAESN
jgi:hypothetical protein